MNILRKLGVGLCATILSVTLLGLAWSSVGLATIRNRNAVKGWLDKSNFYNQVVDVVLEKAKGSSGKGDTDISVDDPNIQAVAKQAFSPEFLKKNIKTVLDSGYLWADGTTNKLAFTIDLTQAKQQLAAGLGAYATTKVAALPVCSPSEVTVDFDSFKATCRPAGITPEQAGQKVTADLLASKEFLAKPVFTADDLKSNDDNSNTQTKPIQDTAQADNFRRAYRLSGYAPVILAVIALITSLCIILLSSDRFRGLKRVGWIIATSGFVLLLTYVVLGFAASVIDRKIAETTSNPAQNKLIGDMGRVIIKDIQKALLPYVIGFTGGGIIMGITGGKVAKRRDFRNKTEFEKHREMLPEPDRASTDDEVEEKNAEDDKPKQESKTTTKKEKS